MRNMVLRLALSVLLVLSLAACSENGDNSDSEISQPVTGTMSSAEGPNNAASTLSVRFGYGGNAFELHLEDNNTAAAIARHVGTADRNLPIYHFDDYEGWEFSNITISPAGMRSHPTRRLSPQAGDVYYSEPNRIVLFYQNAEISGEYTLVGHFDVTEEFISAVEDNPVLEGWGNKIVNISAGK